MRKGLTLVTVLVGAVLISMLSYLVVVLPVAAFSVGSSATGWVTKASAGAVSSYQASALVAEANAIASAAFAAGGTSLAIDVVAAATGWPGLGVAVGLGLLAMYYSSSDLASVKAAAATPGAVGSWWWSLPARGRATVRVYHDLHPVVRGGLGPTHPVGLPGAESSWMLVHGADGVVGTVFGARGSQGRAATSTRPAHQVRWPRLRRGLLRLKRKSLATCKGSP